MVRLGRAGLLAAVVAAALGLLAPAAGAYKPRILQVGFVPSESTTQMSQKVAPLLGELSRRLGMKVVSFVAQDYPGVVEAMRQRKVDAAFLAPLPAVMAEKQAGARLLLKAIRHGRDVFYSAVIVRRDSGLKGLADLKGKRFAFGDPFSMAGSIIPRALLRDGGINPERDLVALPPGGHDATVHAVFDKAADAGAVFCNDPAGREGAWSFYLETPQERAQIVAIAISRPIPNDTFCVRADLDATLVEKLKVSLLAMSKTREGKNQLKEIYHLEGLKEARSEDYESVRAAAKSLGLKIR